jgi:ACT domain
MLKWHDFGLSSEDTIERKRSQDDNFCRAMRAAIYSGTESCPVGVSTEPGTKNPFSTISGSVITERQSRSVSGTVFADGRPRIVDIKGIRMDAGFGPSMIYITNFDKPGFIGRFSSVLGDGGINIATFHVGRDAPGGNAIALIEIDGELPPQVLAAVRALPQVQQAKTLAF